ncbi:MAG: cytidine deaminase [Planctomycetaceae bacterium]|nr:cytidine deaminase [Planctomycetaceae bacterium]
MDVSSLDQVLPNWRLLRDASRQCRLNAHAPYSGYLVGAALLSTCGKIITGCNVENASYGLTICAERTAACAAVAAGVTQFSAICISLKDHAVPCGACRQFLYEFNPDMWVLCDQVTADPVPDDQSLRLFQLRDLLPHAFEFTGSRD